jgi:prepilin-type processing-associated H-X9-DG protein
MVFRAIVSSREAGRRIRCVNNLKQLGLALANYHDLHNTLPPGRIWRPLPGNAFPTFFSGAQNTTWFTLMLPQFEQPGLYSAFNFDTGIEGPINSGAPPGFAANATVIQNKIDLFSCPSDYQQEFRADLGPGIGLTIATRGNYTVSWGNTQWGQQNSAGGTPTKNTPVIYRPSAFGHGTVRLADFRDGTSSTACFAEMIQGRDNDARGLIWSVGINYHSRFTPNSNADYYGVADPPGGGGDRIGVGFCVDDPGNGLPCVSMPFPFIDTYGASRSRHPGGVNVAFADGSVHFIKDSINPEVWLGLNSIRGGEALSADSY